MEIIKLLVPLAILLAVFFVVGFIWMTKKGQYDDLETPGMRMLLEDKISKTDNQTPKGEL